MLIHSISTISLLNLLIYLFDKKPATTVALADDVTSNGQMKNLCKWWELLTKVHCLVVLLNHTDHG